MRVIAALVVAIVLLFVGFVLYVVVVLFPSIIHAFTAGV